MLEELFGSKNRERVLQYILANQQGYAKEIADFYDSSIDPIQKQLERLERGGILVSQTAGRTRLFMFNSRYAFREELIALLEKARAYYPQTEQERLTMRRKRPRRTGKSIQEEQ
jgi:predicted transcriptional regulator